jgi:DNA-binding LytR/AlgR family response regulator
MNTLKIGVVEDELIIAANIIRTLTEIGYTTTEAAISYSEAINMLQQEQPDLLLIDINLSGRRDGIELAEYINKKVKIPFIFLTANSDIVTLEKAKKVNPYAYLIKPFTKEELFVSVEVAFSNYNASKAVEATISSTAFHKQRNAIFLRNKQAFTKVLFSDILFAESCENYIYLYLAGGEKLLHRTTLTDFAALLPEDQFYRCHRSYMVRLDAIQKIEDNYLVIGTHQVPVGKDRMKEVLEALGIEQ